MIVGGLVAEFNPFHKGHAHLIAQLRAQGVTHVVAVMSGAFVQRADAAVCDKWTRAEMALAGGVDLVLELPVPFALAPAPRFAAGGVGTLAALGCVERLGFGSECGDTARLEAAAAALVSEDFRAALQRKLESGVTFAAAQQAALTAVGGEGDLLAGPNDTLAIAYLGQNAVLGSPMTPLAVPRVGAAHDGAPADGFASASWLRARLAAGRWEDAAPYLPEMSMALLTREREAGRCPADLRKLESALLATLRTKSATELAALPDVSEGLEHRLWRAVRQATSVEDVLLAAKTKRYTHARLRRILLYALLGIDRAAWTSPPCYVRVLAMNGRGQEILAAAAPTLPLLTRNKDADALNETAAHLLAAECRADDLYALTQPVVQPAGQTLSRGVIVKD